MHLKEKYASAIAIAEETHTTSQASTSSFSSFVQVSLLLVVQLMNKILEKW